MTVTDGRVRVGLGNQARRGEVVVVAAGARAVPATAIERDPLGRVVVDVELGARRVVQLVAHGAGVEDHAVERIGDASHLAVELGVGERLRRGEAELVPEHPARLAGYDAVKAAGQLAEGGSDHQKVGDAASRYEARRRPGQRGSSRRSTLKFARRLGQRRSRVSPSGQARSQPLKFRLGSVPGDHLPMIRELWRSRYEC